MSERNKHVIRTPFGVTHEFDYTNATHFGYDIFAKNARVLVFIEHNDKTSLCASKLLDSIKNDLELEWPIVNQYIPTGEGLVIDIHTRTKKGKEQEILPPLTLLELVD